MNQQVPIATLQMIAEALKAYGKQKHLSQATIAKRMGISPQRLDTIFRQIAQGKTIRFDTLCQLVDAFDCQLRIELHTKDSISPVVMAMNDISDN